MSGGRPQQGAVTGETQSQSGPYAGSRKYIDDVLRRAQQQFGQGGAFGPDVDIAKDYYKDTLSGKYGVGGEGFNAAFEAAKNKIIPGVESRFASGGRLHSGLARTAETGSLSDAYASLYNEERKRQQEAAGGLGQFGMATSPQAALDAYMRAAYGAPGESSSSGTQYGQQYWKGSPWAGAAGGFLSGLAGGVKGGYF